MAVWGFIVLGDFFNGRLNWEALMNSVVISVRAKQPLSVVFLYRNCM